MGVGALLICHVLAPTCNSIIAMQILAVIGLTGLALYRRIIETVVYFISNLHVRRFSYMYSLTVVSHSNERSWLSVHMERNASYMLAEAMCVCIFMPCSYMGTLGGEKVDA